jgi:hypothetical protein
MLLLLHQLIGVASGTHLETPVLVPVQCLCVGCVDMQQCLPDDIITLTLTQAGF